MADNGWRIGRVAGIPIYISPSWLFIALILVLSYAPIVADRIPDASPTLSYLVAAGFVVLLFGSVLLHELGHALVAQNLGIKVRGMTLWMLGGFTEMRQEPATPGREFLIAAAGPAVSFTLGALGLGALAITPHDLVVVRELALQLAISNITLTIFNLLPGLPLDGGSLVRSLVWRLGNDRHRATIIAGWSGRVVAIVVLAFGLWVAWLGTRTGQGFSVTGLLLTAGVSAFMWFAASQAIQASRMTRRVPSLHLRGLTRPALTVPPDLPLSEALRRVEEDRRSAVVLIDSEGKPIGVVAEHAVAATPIQRRPWVPVSHVARTLEPQLILASHLTGEQLLETMRAHPATEYVVVENNQVFGVLVTADVSMALRRPAS